MLARPHPQMDRSIFTSFRGQMCLVIVAGFIGGLLAMAPTPAQAIQLSLANGEVSGSWDTTVSAGLTWRLEDQDDELIGRANGGTANSGSRM